MKSNIKSDLIQVFPTQNSRDNGKIMLEENLYNTVQRITKLNYAYDEPTIEECVDSFTSLYGIKISAGSNKPHGYNIHGYDIKILNELIICFEDENDTTISHDNPEIVIVTSANYGEDIPFGFVLSKMANTNRLKGDKLSGTTYYYYGVDFMIGNDFISAPDAYKLQLGTVTLTKVNNQAQTSSAIANYNRFIIDADTIRIRIDNEYYSLADYVENNFVAKSGNTYLDQVETLHNSDIYGSLMFREDNESLDFNIAIGRSENQNSMIIKNPTELADNGIQLISGEDSEENNYNKVKIGTFSIENPIPADLDDPDMLELSSSVEPAEIRSTSSITVVSYDLYGYLGTANDFYHGDNEYTKTLGTIFDTKKVEFVHNNDSLIQIRCDDDISRISFGEYETTPIFLDYDTENHNLSVTDKLGAIGVVKFCDGQCVDESEYYSTHDHSSDKPYNYNNPNIPKAYSEQLNNNTNGYYDTKLAFADGSQSHYENSRFDNNGYYDSRSDYYIYTANYANVNTPTDIRSVEDCYGFYISKDWATNKYFKPSAGAFDVNTDSDGNPVSITEKTGYEYANFPSEVINLAVTNTISSYDYITRRFKIPKDLYGKKFLIAEGIALFDIFNYHEDSTYPFDESYGGFIDRNKINAYFCTERASGDSASSLVKYGYETRYPTISDIPNEYTLIQTTKQNGTTTDLLNFEDLCRGNCIVNVPDISSRDSGDLYFVISIPTFCTIVYNRSTACQHINDNGVNKSILIYNPNHFTSPDINLTEGNWNIRGFDGALRNLIFGSNPKKYTVNESYIETDESISQFFDNSNNTLIEYIPQTGLNSMIFAYASIFRFTYTTSKTYKSYRIHGYYDAVMIGGIGQQIATIPSESDVGYGSDYTYQYKCYRLIYELGFEEADIKIEKINNITFDGIPVPSLYKLSRKDGESIIGTASTPFWFSTPNELPYTTYGKYFYVDDLKKPAVFYLGNENYNSDNIIITQDPENTDHVYNYRSSTFYNRSAGNLGKYALIDYTADPGNAPGDSVWFIRNFTVIHGAGINFNVGQNKFIVNVDSYFNETSHVTKIMFGENDELSTTITEDMARFTFTDEDPLEDKPIYKSIRLDKDGLTFEGNPDDITDSSITISKSKDEATVENPDPFNGLEINGDLKANRVFNAVYNDYADNLKCSKVSEYEPGDIICKEPGTDEYVKSTYDLKHLVVGVYSDTYGHLLGGDSMNSNNYVPVALAGNVRVKLIGFAKAGDLVEVSNVPGIGRVAKNPQMGTVIGKVLEDKDTYEVERVLMQVMLL